MILVSVYLLVWDVLPSSGNLLRMKPVAQGSIFSEYDGPLLAVDGTADPAGIMEIAVQHKGKHIHGYLWTWVIDTMTCANCVWLFIYFADRLLKNVFVRVKYNSFNLTSCPIPATSHSRISNYTRHKVWDEITYPFPNLNDAAVEVWELIINFITHFTGYVVTYSCWI